MADHGFTFQDLFQSRWKWTDEANEPQHTEMDAWREAAGVYFVTVVVGQLFSLLAIRRRTPYCYPLPSRTNPVERTPDHTRWCSPHCFDIQWSVLIALLLDAQNTASLDIIPRIAQPCPFCHVMTQRNGGCTHMICLRCGRDWTWDAMYELRSLRAIGAPAPTAVTDAVRREAAIMYAANNAARVAPRPPPPLELVL
eukprot:gene31763-39240_t